MQIAKHYASNLHDSPFRPPARCLRNQDLDAVVRRRQDRGQALRRHAGMVCGRFVPSARTSRSVDGFGRCLPEHAGLPEVLALHIGAEASLPIV